VYSKSEAFAEGVPHELYNCGNPRVCKTDKTFAKILQMTFENAGFPSANFPAVQDFLSQSNLMAKFAISIKKILESATIQVNNGKPSLALYTLEDNRKFLEELKRFNLPAYLEFEKLYEFVFQETARFVAEFPVAFPEEVSKLGLVFSEGTQHPTYILEKGLIEVKFDSRKKIVLLKTRSGQSQILGVEAGKVADFVLLTLKRLLDRKIEIAEMRTRLQETFQVVRDKNGPSGMDHIKILEYLKTYQKIYNCLADEAIMDLSKTYKSIEILKLDYIKNHEQGILLYGFEANGYFGFMRLEE
jgi:hypothetical protein